MTDNRRIKQLFERLLNNSITKNELDELLTYVHNSETGDEVKEWMDLHWENVEMNLNPTNIGLRSEERYTEILRKIDKRHRHLSKNKKNTFLLKKIHFQWISIAASLLIILSTGIYWFTNWNTPSGVPFSEPVATINYSGQQFVHLPDGSTVILNKDSKLLYDENFGKNTREVTFSGEGYFDIAHDSDRPFIVHSGEVKTTVLGTAFNLNAYENKSEVVVTVARGKVAVGDDDQEYEKILPKQQLVVHKQTRKFEKEEVDLDRVLAWKENFLILDGITIEKAIELIGDRYHVEIAIENNKMKNCTINAAFMKGESLEQILRVICGVLQAEFLIDGDAVSINGGRICE